MTRGIGLSACSLLGITLAGRRLSRHHAQPVVRRYIVASLAVLTGQHLLTARIARRQLAASTSITFPSVADALTLGRAAAGAHALGLSAAAPRATTSLTGPLCWAPLLVAVSAADWVDGWCARRIGQDNQWGSMLDVEVDSWLTFCSACAAVSVGGLPGYVIFTPLLRHILFWHTLSRGMRPAERYGGSWWARTIGTAQMAVLLGVLLRREFPGKDLLRAGARIVSLLSAASLLGQWVPYLTQSDKDAHR